MQITGIQACAFYRCFPLGAGAAERSIDLFTNALVFPEGRTPTSFLQGIPGETPRRQSEFLFGAVPLTSDRLPARIRQWLEDPSTPYESDSVCPSLSTRTSVQIATARETETRRYYSLRLLADHYGDLSMEAIEESLQIACGLTEASVNATLQISSDRYFAIDFAKLFDPLKPILTRSFRPGSRIVRHLLLQTDRTRRPLTSPEAEIEIDDSLKLRVGVQGIRERWKVHEMTNLATGSAAARDIDTWCHSENSVLVGELGEDDRGAKIPPTVVLKIRDGKGLSLIESGQRRRAWEMAKRIEAAFREKM